MFWSSLCSPNSDFASWFMLKQLLLWNWEAKHAFIFVLITSRFVLQITYLDKKNPILLYRCQSTLKIWVKGVSQLFRKIRPVAHIKDGPNPVGMAPLIASSSPLSPRNWLNCSLQKDLVWIWGRISCSFPVVSGLSVIKPVTIVCCACSLL